MAPGSHSALHVVRSLAVAKEGLQIVLLIHSQINLRSILCTSTWSRYKLHSFPSQDRAKQSPIMPRECCVIIQPSGGAYRVRSRQQPLLPGVKAYHLCDTSEHQRFLKRVPLGHSQIQVFCVAARQNHWDGFASAVRTGVFCSLGINPPFSGFLKKIKLYGEQGERSREWCFHLT